MRSSALQTLARESKNGRLRAAFLAPHVSEEALALKVLRRLRYLRGPLLVECGPLLFLSTGNYQDAISPRCGNAQITIVAPRTARGHSDLVLRGGPCRFARDNVLVQFSRLKTSQETAYLTLSLSGKILGARSCGELA